MKQGFNFELVIFLVLVLVGFFDFSLWRNVDPTTLSDEEKEKIGLTKVHNITKDNLLQDLL